MHFASWSEFFAMGGYAFYVWLAFGITFAAMIGIAVNSVLTRRKIFNEIKNRIAREARIEKAKTMENTL